MKKLSLIIACAGLLLCACISNKQLDVTPATQPNILSTLDGATENFIADSVETNGTISILIWGTDRSNKDQIRLELLKMDDTVDVGTYGVDSLGTPGVRNGQIMITDNRDSTLNPNTTGPYYTAGTGPTNARYPGTITLTTLSDTLLKGTFSGIIACEKQIVLLQTPVATKTVTNGSFSVRLKNVKVLHMAALRRPPQR